MNDFSKLNKKDNLMWVIAIGVAKDIADILNAMMTDSEWWDYVEDTDLLEWYKYTKWQKLIERSREF